MAHHLRMIRNRLFLPAIMGALFCFASQAFAEDVERRDFSILVDGKEAGQSHMTITVQEDGTTVMNAQVKVRFTKFFVPYTYAIETSEWWKAGQLIALKSAADDNGTKTDVQVSPDGQKLRVRINGKDTQARPDVWTTSYWKLADARFHNKAVPLFDPETGKSYDGQLQYVATEQLTVNNQPQNCYHFHVTGGPDTIELWFDRYHRLVRQEFSDWGVKTIVQLVNVRR